jgi:AcrR family transcriptional regulator
MHTPLTSLRGMTTAAALGYGRIPTGRRPQGQRAGTRNRAVLDAAAEVVGRRGLDALTPTAVGAAAGYSRALVGDRAALLEALTKDLQDRFVPPADDGPGLERLLAAVDAYLRAGADVFVTLWAHAVAGEPDLQDPFAARDARFRATLAGYLHDGIADGSIRADVDPDALAATLVGQLRAARLLPGARTELVALLERGLRTG